jgi:hypothetical protein
MQNHTPAFFVFIGMLLVALNGAIFAANLERPPGTAKGVLLTISAIAVLINLAMIFRFLTL